MARRRYRSYPRTYYLNLITGRIETPGKGNRYMRESPDFLFLRYGYGTGRMKAEWIPDKYGWLIHPMYKGQETRFIGLTKDQIIKRHEYMVYSLPTVEKESYVYDKYGIKGKTLISAIFRVFYNGEREIYVDGNYKDAVKYVTELSDEIEKCDSKYYPISEYREIIRHIVLKCTNEEIKREIAESVGGWHRLLDIIKSVPINVCNDGCNDIYLHRIGSVSYLVVTCPSTGRQYALCPPDQWTDNAYEAWRSLFPEPITYRHGDVGIHYIGEGNELIEQS